MGARVAAVAAVAASLLAGRAGAADLGLTTGVGYSTGSYGASRPTDTVLVPLTARLRAGRWTFTASTEWISVDGPGEVGAGLAAAGRAGKRDKQGFTDSNVSARYSFDHLGGTPAYLDVRGKVRFPTASDRSLGQGGMGYIADAELGADWRTAGAYFDLGRRFMTDSGRVDRSDIWAYAVGGWARYDRRTELGLWYNAHGSATGTTDGSRRIGAYVSRDLASAWRAEITLYEGLTPSSPDFGGNIRFSWRPGNDFRRRPFD
jgi:hypothetical protein